MRTTLPIRHREASPKAMYPPDTILVRNDALPTGEVDGELVALDMEKGDCFGLDPIGTDIWHMAASPVRFDALIEQLVERYDVGTEDCARDLQPFIEEMVGAGLLRINP